jgi:PEP-CTERM motif-containing protein
MNWKTCVIIVVLGAIGSPACAAPILSVVPQGLQGGNWVWEVDIAPDIVAAGGPTPLAIELGFRLSGDPLVSVTNLTPAVYDTNNPGKIIFGWETTFADANNNPVGIEANCASCTVTNLAPIGTHPSTVVPGITNEIFSAMGTGVIPTATPVPFLRVVALGPANGGPSSSTIQWLGAYGGKGRISQIVGANAVNFDIYAGSATQVPEPTSLGLVLLGSVAIAGQSRRRPIRA